MDRHVNPNVIGGHESGVSCYHGPMTTRSDSHAHRRAPIRPSEQASEYGELQRMVDALYEHGPSQAVSRIDVLVRAEIDDLGPDLMEVVELLPAGSYKRSRLCDQLNSIITAHGWGYLYGTVE